MADLRCDLYAFPFTQNDFVMFKEQPPFAFKDKKELAGVRVIMHHLRAASRDALPDHTHVITFEQVPAIAHVTPTIVFNVFDRNDHI